MRGKTFRKFCTWILCWRNPRVRVTKVGSITYDFTRCKSTTSRYGFKLGESRNLWEGSAFSVVTDIKWEAGGELYSSPPFLFICFRDPLSPKAQYFPSLPLARLASNPPIARFSELILLLLHIADFSYR